MPDNSFAMSLRARRLFQTATLLCGLAAPLASTAPALAQGTPQTIAAQIQFLCPGATAVSATATDLQVGGRTSTRSVIPLNPAEAAESPCLYADAGPVLEWSADYNALRMTAPGTWKDKLRTVLKDFDTLHAQYVANPQIKDMGMWPARLQEVFELAVILTRKSGRADAEYYAQALQDEYKSGIFDARPLLLSYALQAREKLGELAAPEPPAKPKIRR